MAVASDGYWAKTGHRVVGEIAQEYINGKTKRALKELLGTESLAEVANFADEIKSDTIYRKFGAWHYVNYPLDKKYHEVTPSKFGDIVQAIAACQQKVSDKNLPQSERSFYLKFLIHLIGDLHQPMHAGRAEDRGGNDIQLQWFDTGTNLHRVWDGDMINFNGMSFSELADRLSRLNRKKVRALQAGSVVDWLEESHEIAGRIYSGVNTGEKLRFRYSYIWWPTVEDQLQKGGVRLAKVLNELFR
jgi:predicted CopG family antitoxin